MSTVRSCCTVKYAIIIFLANTPLTCVKKNQFYAFFYRQEKVFIILKNVHQTTGPLMIDTTYHKPPLLNQEAAATSSKSNMLL